MPDDEGHLLRRAERRSDDEVAFVLAVVVVRDDDDLAAGESLDGFGDGMGHESILQGSRQEIVRGHGATGLARDEFRRLTGEPDLCVVAELGDGTGRHPDPAGEFHPGDALAGQPIGEFHGRILAGRRLLAILK